MRLPVCAPNALITVTIARHPVFERDGANLRLDLPVTLYEAALGGKVRVPTLEGAVVTWNLTPAEWNALTDATPVDVNGKTLTPAALSVAAVTVGGGALLYRRRHTAQCA